MLKLMSVFAVVVIAGSAQAQITAVDLGTDAPPATIGTYTMSPFGDDTRPTLQDVTGVSLADGAPWAPGIGFSVPLSHRQIGDGWETWSHGYGGDVYYTGDLFSVEILLPADTGAFYFYAEPDPFNVVNITATANDGTTLTIGVAGEFGANGFGFWTSGPSLSSITVSSDATFAVGEFGIARAIPAPGGAALLGVMGVGGVVRSRRRRA